MLRHPERPIAVVVTAAGAALSAWGARAAVAPVPEPTGEPNAYLDAATRGAELDLTGWAALVLGLVLMSWALALVAARASR